MAESMQESGFKARELKDLSVLLALVLQMGNIDFVEAGTGGRDDASFDLQLVGPVAELAELLGCEAADLSNALSTAIIVTRGETIVMKNSASNARDTRDAAAKALYGRLFHWIVGKANAIIAPPADAVIRRNIAILDMFGFENFAVNSLEQLCINVANEQLQFFFNEHVFAWQQQELVRSGVSVHQRAHAHPNPLSIHTSQ